VRICFFLSLFVQAASITWIASLASTSASVNSAIYQTSCVFAYLFSIPLLSERVSFGKSAAVVLAVFGVLGVIFSKKPKGSLDDKPNAGVGELLVVLSAAFYALKEVLYKLWFPNCTSSRTPVSDAAVCVSVVGAWCTLMLPLWVLLLHSTQIELFEWPPADVARGYAIVALMMSGFQVLLFAAIAVTSPTFAAVGQLMVPPLSMLWDYVAFRFALSPLGICGSFMVIIAILFMLQNERVDEIVHPIIYRMCHRSRDLSTTTLLAGTAPNPAGAAPVSSMNEESSSRIAYLEAQEEKAQESPIL